MATILIVEDDKSLHKAYKMILEKQGYRILSAFNGAEALERAHAHTPDLILLDLHMPKMSGLAFLKKFEKHQGKIIVFSNLDAKKDIDTAYSLGADRYILKAWASPQELVKVVHDALTNA